jgi:hypothetical protein
VTVRWLFYALLQEGWYSTKKDYKDKFLRRLSEARRHFYKSWRPNTLVDDTREAMVRGVGFDSVRAWLQAVPDYFPCQLDRWTAQATLGLYSLPVSGSLYLFLFSDHR